MVVWYNIIVVSNMLINIAVKNEAIRNQQMISEYKKLISDLPKGSLICRKNEYYYLKYRDGKKVVSQYISKDRIDEVSLKIQKRKHVETMIKSLKKELDIANRILEAEL